MGNKIVRLFLAIFIVAALGTGIYMILPGQYKNPLTETFQSMTNKYDKEAVSTLKKADVPGHKGVTFDKMMTSATANPAWVVKNSSINKDTGTGTMVLEAHGYKATISMTDAIQTDSTNTYTNVPVTLNFNITMTNGKVTAVKFASVIVEETTFHEGVKTNNEDIYFQGTLDSMCSNISAN